MKEFTFTVVWVDGGKMTVEVTAESLNAAWIAAAVKGGQATYNGRRRDVAALRWHADPEGLRR